MQKYILIIIFMIFSIFPATKAQWEQLSTNDQYINMISIDPFNDYNMLVSNTHSLFYSTDKGTTFRIIKTPPDWNSIWSMSLYKGIIYIYDIKHSKGIYLSKDTAKTWEKIYLYWILNGNNRSDTLYCGVIMGDQMQISESRQLVGGGGMGLYLSPDNFKNWKIINYRDSTANIALYRPPEEVVSFTFNDSLIITHELGGRFGGLLLTSNDGRTWKRIDSNLISYDPTDQYRTTFLKLFGNRLFFSIENKGIFRTEDFGLTWKKVSTETGNLRKVCNNVLFLLNGKLFFSLDFGDSWQELDASLYDSEDPNIGDFGFNSEYFYIGFSGIHWQPKYYGLYRTRIKDCLPLYTDIEEIHLPRPEGIYPNPATDFIEISVGSIGRSPLQSDVRIYNVLGEIQTTPSLRDTPPWKGGEIVKIDVSGLAPGMYFVRTGDRVSNFVKI